MNPATQDILLKLTTLLKAIGLSLCILLPKLEADELYTPAEAWQGEYLAKDYGAFYLKIRQQGFKKNARGLFITSNVFLHLKELPDGRHFLIRQPLGLNTQGQTPIWKLPVGNYLIQKINLSDNSGISRTWTGTGKTQISIRHLFLSNLGTLLVSPEAEAGLSTVFQAGVNTFINSYQHEAFAAVIDGYTQKVQKKLGGTELFARAEGEYGSENEARATFTQQRQVAMLYKVDLGRDQRFSKKIVAGLITQDLDLRTCYTDQLDQDASLQGNVAFKFQISGSDGTMQNIKVRHGTLKSKKVIECLYFTLARMQFPLAQKLEGQVTFYFNFKDEAGRATP